MIKKATLSIFGLGYVGSVCSACFSSNGINVVGVDSNGKKVKYINKGLAPIVEKGLEDLIKDGVARGLLKATNNPDEAISSTNITFVSVGTPSNPNGSLNLDYITAVCQNIGSALKNKNEYHIVVVRSTVLPGTTENHIVPLIELHSGKSEGEGFGVVFNPEFLREGSAIYDFYNPPKTVIGANRSSDAKIISELYSNLDAPLFITKLKTAETVKYADNAFHALKVAFGNEIGVIAKSFGVDSHEVMDIFCSDTKLNLSPYYLKPGFAFGGSCLPKDLRALNYLGKSNDINLPLLRSVLLSNQEHIDRILNRILEINKKKIGVLGFSFKEGTDDLRESPIITLIETLLGKGYDLKLFDQDVTYAQLLGSNKEYINVHLPHITNLITPEVEDVINHSEILILGKKNKFFKEAVKNLKTNQHVIDLVRISKSLNTKATYEGICW